MCIASKVSSKRRKSIKGCQKTKKDDPNGGKPHVHKMCTQSLLF